MVKDIEGKGHMKNEFASDYIAIDLEGLSMITKKERIDENRKSQKKRKRQTKKFRDKFIVGVVLGLHRIIFYSNGLCLRKRKFVVKKVNKYGIMIKTKLDAWGYNCVKNKL